MNNRDLISTLDNLLRPLGYARQNAVWNRKSGHFVEVIDLQVSKAGDAATVNSGVLDTEVYLKLWGSEPPNFVEEPACTVRARVGELVHGKDVWWQLNDDGIGEVIAGATADYVLPFVKRMSSREAMVQWLSDTDVLRKRYPPMIINFAILHGMLGRKSEACALLANLESKAVGAWRARAAEVAARLGCGR